MSIFVNNLVQIEPNNINLMKEQVCKCNQSTCLKRAKDTMTMSRRLTQISTQSITACFIIKILSKTV